MNPIAIVSATSIQATWTERSNLSFAEWANAPEMIRNVERDGTDEESHSDVFLIISSNLSNSRAVKTTTATPSQFP